MIDFKRYLCEELKLYTLTCYFGVDQRGLNASKSVFLIKIGFIGHEDIEIFHHLAHAIRDYILYLISLLHSPAVLCSHEGLFEQRRGHDTDKVVGSWVSRTASGGVYKRAFGVDVLHVLKLDRF